MELQTVHLLVVSDFWYLQNSTSCFDIIVIFGWNTRFLGYRLLKFKDIENRRRPKDAPHWATYFTYQTLNCLINICGPKEMVRLKHRWFSMALLPRRPIKPASSKNGTVANTSTTLIEVWHSPKTPPLPLGEPARWWRSHLLPTVTHKPRKRRSKWLNRTKEINEKTHHLQSTHPYTCPPSSNLVSSPCFVGKFPTSVVATKFITEWSHCSIETA